VRNQHDLRTASRAFIAAAFDVLTEEHVIPTPIFHPYVAVGRDYFGDSMRGLAAFHALETQLKETYPNRFAELRERREFAELYISASLRRASPAVGTPAASPPTARRWTSRSTSC
jgi:hypothetical protein